MSRHFLVIGGQRCGTTYLHTLLEQHPDVVMARPVRPEPKVFLDAEASRRGLDWYRRSYFAHAGDESRWGEKSTSYIESADAAERARAVLGEADVVVVVRDPVLRAVSNWRFSTDNGYETRPLAVALEQNLRDGAPVQPGRTSVSPFAYLERGRFTDYLAPWDRAFPDRVRVHLLAELVHDEGAVAALYRGLGVDDTVRPAAFGDPVNVSEHPAPALDHGFVERLRGYFADSDRALADRLGRRLPWPSAG